jgi:phytoene dehydrogenase-like protein
MPKLTHYDVIILGAGHNALVAAAYLGRAGFSVLILEKNDYIGGATTSQQLFPEFDARLSRYSYLVSLFPEQLVRELGLKVEFRRREISSFTPYRRGEQQAGLLLSNASDEVSRASLRELVGSDREFEGMRSFYNLARTFADKVWDYMLQPLPTRQELEHQLSNTEEGRLAWRSLIEEPIGQAIERHFQSDLMRGVALTDAKIGLFTHSHDPSLLQNRCFLYHAIGNRKV